MADLVKKLKSNNIDVFLVSGGFRQMIKVGPVISYVIKIDLHMYARYVPVMEQTVF